MSERRPDRQAETKVLVHEPSAAELQRLIERNHRDLAADLAELKTQLAANIAAITTRLDRYLLADVYHAHDRARTTEDQAQDDQINDLKDEIVAARRGNRAAMLAAAGSFAGAVAFVAFQTLVKGGT